MREFNTSGICLPEFHYYVPRQELLTKTLAQIRGKQSASGARLGGRYFTLYAPRQSGKSTFIAAIKRSLEDDFLFLDLSFEGLSDLEEKRLCQEVTKLLKRKLELVGILLPPEGEPQDIAGLPDFFVTMRKLTPKKLVLAIDEFDALNEDYLGKLLHIFRKIYTDRDTLYNLHSLILIGVRNLTEINLANASPFNIADAIYLQWFTREEVFALMGQYEEETGQTFHPDVKEKIYTETNGQPGLVNELCQLLVEDFNPTPPAKWKKEGAKPTEIGMEVLDKLLRHYLTTYISKNVSNILNKARTYEEKILSLFNTAEKIPYAIDEPWQKYLQVNGVITYEDDPISDRRYVKFSCPIYQKKLYAYFKPKINPETKYYLQPGEDYRLYLNPDGTLNLPAVLENYQRYLNRRGRRAFAFARQRENGTRVEAAYHYSLDCYLDSMAAMFGGRTEVEFPTGNGKVDIFLHLPRERYVIEVKNYVNEYLLQQAKLQAVRYARSEGLAEAYLAVFTEADPPGGRQSIYKEVLEGNILHLFWLKVPDAS